MLGLNTKSPSHIDAVVAETHATQAGFRRNRRATRGSTLLLVLLLLLVFAVTTVMVMNVASTTVRSAHVRTDQVEALNMADAGVDLATAWLEQQATPPVDTTLRNMTNLWGTNGTFPAPFGVTGTSLQITIYSDSNNPSNTQKKYIIDSKATMPSGVTQIVRAYVGQKSFANYAYFMVNDAGFWDYNNHFEGPFHSNDANGTHSTFLWQQNPAGGPIFTYSGTDAFSVSGNPVWWLNTLNSVHAPSTTSDFNSIAIGGQTTMKYGFDSTGQPNSKVVALPTTDYTQEYVALGQTPPSSATSAPSGLPTTTGATLTTGGGIFIHGNSTVALSVDSSGNQVFTVTTVSGTTTKVQTITATTTGASMVSVSTPATGSPTTTNTSVGTALNGLVFSDGNITALSGTVANNRVNSSGVITYRNSWTIAADTAASKDITLSASIRYSTSRNLAVSESADTNFTTYAGTLGIMAHNVNVAAGAASPLEFDAAIFATNTFQAANYNLPTGSSGSMTSIGGVVVHDAGYFAIANSSGVIQSGYNELYHYDTRMPDYPPPYFPTTSSQYKLISWQNVTSTIQ